MLQLKNEYINLVLQMERIEERLAQGPQTSPPAATPPQSPHTLYLRPLAGVFPRQNGSSDSSSDTRWREKKERRGEEEEEREGQGEGAAGG